MRQTKIRTRRGDLRLLVPTTPTERQIGMNHGTPRPFVGMVFNFDPPSIPVMTMEETAFPLQIAFLGPDRVVHTVHDAPPRSGRYSTSAITRWVIETYAALRLLRVGDRVDFAP